MVNRAGHPKGHATVKMVLGPFPERKGPRLPGRNPASKRQVPQEPSEKSNPLRTSRNVGRELRVCVNSKFDPIPARLRKRQPGRVVEMKLYEGSWMWGSTEKHRRLMQNGENRKEEGPLNPIRCRPRDEGKTSVLREHYFLETTPDPLIMHRPGKDFVQIAKGASWRRPATHHVNVP